MKSAQADWPRLAFSGRPEFHEGLNVTVRLGDKWLKSYLQGKDQVVVLDGDGKKVGEAYIAQVAYLPFNEIPERWLLQNHDPDCRTLVECFDEITFNYANAKKRGRRTEKISPNDYVTVVWFETF